MISSTDFTAEVYTRMDNVEWNFNMTKERKGIIQISAIDYDLSLNDVYAKVDDLLP